MSRADFRAPVSRRGRRVKQGPLILHVMRVTDVPPGGEAVRVGFAVGKQVGGAVTRNLVRRRLREAAGIALRDVSVVPGEGRVVLVRAMPGADRIALPELATLLKRGLSS